MPAIRIGFVIRGKLTKKQERTIEIVSEVLHAFYNEKQAKQEKTWKELLTIFGKKRKGTLHKWLYELVRQGVVKGEVKAHNGKLERFFKYTEDFVEIEGKAPIREKEVLFVPKDKVPKEFCTGYIIYRRGKRPYWRVPRETSDKSTS